MRRSKPCVNRASLVLTRLVTDSIDQPLRPPKQQAITCAGAANDPAPFGPPIEIILYCEVKAGGGPCVHHHNPSSKGVWSGPASCHLTNRST